MINKSVKAELIWISTDCEGHIEQISPAAGELLGVPARGQNLALFFPMHSKQIAFDMEVALTGWPSRRMAMLERMARRPLLIEYVVSARFTSYDVELYWFFELRAVDTTVRAH